MVVGNFFLYRLAEAWKLSTSSHAHIIEHSIQQFVYVSFIFTCILRMRGILDFIECHCLYSRYRWLTFISHAFSLSRFSFSVLFFFLTYNVYSAFRIMPQLFLASVQMRNVLQHMLLHCSIHGIYIDYLNKNAHATNADLHHQTTARHKIIRELSHANETEKHNFHPKNKQQTNEKSAAPATTSSENCAIWSERAACFYLFHVWFLWKSVFVVIEVHFVVLAKLIWFHISHCISSNVYPFIRVVCAVMCNGCICFSFFWFGLVRPPFFALLFYWMGANWMSYSREKFDAMKKYRIESERKERKEWKSLCHDHDVRATLCGGSIIFPVNRIFYDVWLVTHTKQINTNPTTETGIISHSSRYNWNNFTK